jgi:hypothetical protein
MSIKLHFLYVRNKISLTQFFVEFNLSIFSSSSTLIFKIELGRLRSRKELASRKTRQTAELKLKRHKIESN